MELKIYQGRYTAFLYSFIVVLLFGYFFVFIALYRIMQTINILPIIIICEAIIVYIMCFLTLKIILSVKLNANEITIKGQHLCFMPKSFTIHPADILQVREGKGIDEYFFKNNSFLTMYPKYIKQPFIYFDMKDGKTYPLWIKHFSKREIKNIIDLTNHFIQVNSTKNI